MLSKKELEDLGYYIIKKSDGDKFYYEVYADDEVIHTTDDEREAMEYLKKLTDFIQN